MMNASRALELTKAAFSTKEKNDLEKIKLAIATAVEKCQTSVEFEIFTRDHTNDIVISDFTPKIIKELRDAHYIVYTSFDYGSRVEFPTIVVAWDTVKLCEDERLLSDPSDTRVHFPTRTTRQKLSFKILRFYASLRRQVKKFSYRLFHLFFSK